VKKDQNFRVGIGCKVTLFYPDQDGAANNQSLKGFFVTFKELKIPTDMNRPLQLKKRFQLGAVLLVLLIGIVLNNVSSKMNLGKVDTSVTSIYNDRLLAATYIFELSNSLYEKNGLDQAAHEQQAQLDRNIKELIRKYDHTALTVKEAGLWRSFKHNLGQYNIAGPQQEAFFFGRAISDLKALSTLQANEGSSLFRKTQSSITAFTLSSNLEIALAVGLGIITLILIGASKEAMLTFNHPSSLN
jgi:hypothetical protein